MAFDIDSLGLKTSVVSKTTDNLSIFLYGYNGLGKTQQAVKFPKPLFISLQGVGLEGLNGVTFKSIKTWSELKTFINTLVTHESEIKEQYQTIILDEIEIAQMMAEKYVCDINGVTKIKEGNSGYGLWKELDNEISSTFLKLIGTSFCKIYITHPIQLESGQAFPAGDVKRFLPILLNHSAVIGYVKGNGIDADGKPIHSSLELVQTSEWFARTKNMYFPTEIEDFTADNFLKAYYDAIDKQTEVDGVQPITYEEQKELYATGNENVDFEDLIADTQNLCRELAEKASIDKVTKIVEDVLGVDKKLSGCTEQQLEGVMVIKNTIEEELKKISEKKKK